ncbi:ABC transporter substrate-binding protein [Ancylothrix sp. C2]|uniref:ABC transporter substrate-binding protein n=1 Tax=Ancylothrix sp. D3o TaxID=2953691 RepID=UPI0021BAC441|nr:ABC transporter substrate-binding protein [Ancylothrix sp. D3o]MCT7948459.1 ABC transporter substrate-binding protein [Ancylothrix sp. D3o]
MSQKNEAPVLILSLLITVGLLAGGFWWLMNRSGVNFPLVNSSQNSGGNVSSGRLSLGEKILITADTNNNKKAGVEAFAKGDYATAIREFQTSLQQNRNDPESLIYLNNAKAALTGKVYKIATSVPVGGNLNVAKELLRGVAQAQDEFNQAGGLNGVLLQVVIANDDNDASVAKNVAQELVNDSSILGVVGHNASEASLAAAPVYQQGKLVMISPTSHAKSLSSIGSYIFRTIPSIRFDATVLSRYAAGKEKLKNIAICADSQAEASLSFKEEFTSNFFADGGKISGNRCDFSAADFNAQKIVSQAVSDGADGLLLAVSVGNINRAIQVAKANKNRLHLLGSYALYTFQTLDQGKADVNGMLLAVPWHPAAIENNLFTENAAKLWGGSVNWRTALAYDATQAIIAAFKGGSSRESLQKTLSSLNFSTEGATGRIQFLPSGDRNGASQLVKIVPGGNSGTGFDFVPVR